MIKIMCNEKQLDSFASSKQFVTVKCALKMGERRHCRTSAICNIAFAKRLKLKTVLTDVTPSHMFANLVESNRKAKKTIKAIEVYI